MRSELLLQIGPLIGGGVLLLICFVNIIRSSAISNANAAVLALGGLMFVLPSLGSFNIESPMFKVSGQVAAQGAEIKLDLTEIRRMVEGLIKASGSTAATATVSAEIAKNRGSLVFIIYGSGQKNLAQRIEAQLLRKGYAANAVYTDYSELDDSKKGQPGTARFVYTEKTKSIADALKVDVKGQIPTTNFVPDRIVERLPADAQIQLY